MLLSVTFKKTFINNDYWYLFLSDFIYLNSIDSLKNYLSRETKLFKQRLKTPKKLILFFTIIKQI